MTGLVTMPLLAKRCSKARSPEQRRRDDAIVLGSGLFTVFLCVFVVLFG